MDIKQLKEILEIVESSKTETTGVTKPIGAMVLVRTYSAGVFV